MPSGSGGIVVDVRVFNRHGIEKMKDQLQLKELRLKVYKRIKK